MEALDLCLVFLCLIDGASANVYAYSGAGGFVGLVIIVILIRLCYYGYICKRAAEDTRPNRIIVVRPVVTRPAQGLVDQEHPPAVDPPAYSSQPPPPYTPGPDNKTGNMV